MGRRETTLRFFNRNDDFMKGEVEANIEKYRKGDFRFRITDKDGKPLDGAVVEIEQLTHEFKFGANIFMLDELETEEKNAAYKKAFAGVFNLATIPFYWDALEPERGKPRFDKNSPKIYRRPATDLCVDFCVKNGIEPKCHCLNYDNFAPDWVRAMGLDDEKAAIEERMRTLAERYSFAIPSWEVTNETLDPDDKSHANKTPFYNEDDFVEWSFLTADKYFKQNRLIINDYGMFGASFRGNRSPYFMQIERLLRTVKHLDGIGMQFHGFYKPEDEEKQAYYMYNPRRLYTILDRYASLDKSLQITEMTIPAFSASETDVDIQAELIEKIYTLFFSHPSMEAIIYWNLVDGYAAWAPQGDMTKGENVYYGGLMNFDLTPKKSYAVLRRLIKENWHTSTSAATRNGTATMRGFYGKYSVKVSYGGKTVSFTIDASKRKENFFAFTL